MSKRKLSLTIAILCLYSLSLTVQAADEVANIGTVTIGKDTTFFTAPLTDDGRVDYLAALNAHFGRGVTPDKNAVAGFWQVLGPQDQALELRDEFFKLLGIASPAEVNDNHFVALDAFARARQANDQAIDEAYKQLQDEASRRPWSADDFPLLAAWLAENEEPLTRFVNATRRPRVRSLAGLSHLSLEKTKVTDEGLKTIAKMQNLDSLDLSSTQITKAGLEHLRAMSNLRMLTLLATRIPKKAVEELRKTLPQCLIFHYFE